MRHADGCQARLNEQYRQGSACRQVKCCITFIASEPEAGAGAAPADHREFEATLYAPYKADAGAGPAQPDARTFTLNFDYPGLERPQSVDWQLELEAPSGAIVQRWQGAALLLGEPLGVPVRWSGRHNGQPLAPGLYRVRMRAASRDVTPDAPGRSTNRAWRRPPPSRKRTPASSRSTGSSGA
jgi:hypothetical protein